MHTTIQNIVDNPFLLHQINDEQLDNWILQYPLVALFQVEKYKRNKTEQQLAKASFYVCNRDVLYQIDIDNEIIIKDDHLNKQIETKPIEINSNIKNIEQSIDDNSNESNLSVQQENGITSKEIILSDEIPVNKNLSIADIILQEIELLKKQNSVSEEIVLTPENNIVAIDVEKNQLDENIRNDTKNNISEEIIEIDNKNLDKSIDLEKTEDIAIIEKDKSNDIYIPIIDISEKIEPIIFNKDNQINIDQTLSAENNEHKENINDESITIADKILEELYEIRNNRKNTISIDSVTKIKSTLNEAEININQTIPNVEEDKNESEVDSLTENQSQEINSTIEPIIVEPKNNNQSTFVKEETHTFLEWLNIIDKNFEKNTQTTPAIKHIVPYENQFIIENKEEYKQGILEGEIDQIEEIDEDVSKLADESISFKNELATETLAIIFTKQEKYDKAIEVYEKLMLKYPEKSVRFATQIQKIKNLT